MICKKCGRVLLSTDIYCPDCIMACTVCRVKAPFFLLRFSKQQLLLIFEWYGMYVDGTSCLFPLCTRIHVHAVPLQGTRQNKPIGLKCTVFVS